MSDLVAVITARLSEGRRVSDEDVLKLLAHIAGLQAALYQYINHVVSCEGISFIDVDQPWAKLINETWGKQAALEGEWDGSI